MDNSAVLHALRSRRSPNRIANAWLRRLFTLLPADFTYSVSHIRTEYNPADKFTRTMEPVGNHTTDLDETEVRIEGKGEWTLLHSFRNALRG